MISTNLTEENTKNVFYLQSLFKFCQNIDILEDSCVAVIVQSDSVLTKYWSFHHVCF